MGAKYNAKMKLSKIRQKWKKLLNICNPRKSIFRLVQSQDVC